MYLITRSLTVRTLLKNSQRKIGFITAPFALTILLLILSISLVKGQPTCQLRRNKDSIKVYVCQRTDSKFKTVKASFTVDASYSEIVAMFLDVENFSTWQYKTKHARVLKNISERVLIYYAEVEVPWPLLNRDIILQMKITQDPFTHWVTISSNSLPDYIEKIDNLVRVRSFRSTWTLKAIGNNKTQIEYVTQIDPGGSLPPGIVNIFAAQGPLETFRSLKQQIYLHNKLNAGSIAVKK